MAKKKTVTKIDTVHVEIDYDKLAEAIVKAQHKTEMNIRTPSKRKENFFKAVIEIYRGKSSPNSRYLSSSFAMVLTLLFSFTGYIGALASILLGGYSAFSICKHIMQGPWNELIAALDTITICLNDFLLAAFSVLCFSVSTLLVGAGNDVAEERDKNYVVSVFSGIVGLAALVVALVALIR